MTSLVYALLFSLAIATSVSSQSTTPQTPYELFANNDIPVGILPQGMADYQVNETEGLWIFSIGFDGECSFEIGGRTGNRLVYGYIVSGAVAKGEIYSLHGVSLIHIGYSYPISDIKRANDMLYFYSATRLVWLWPVSEFGTSPQCEEYYLALRSQ